MSVFIKGKFFKSGVKRLTARRADSRAGVLRVNVITIYLAQRIVSFSMVSDFLFGGTVALLPARWRSVGSALAYIAVCWLLLYSLYRKNIFIKV